VPVVALLSWILVPRTIAGFDGWRIVVLIGATGAIFIWWIRLGLPESPRWLANRGRVAEAASIVSMLETKIERETKRKLPPPQLLENETHAFKGSWWQIWQRPYLSRTVILVIFNLFQTVGYYGFASWVPQFLIAHGIDITRTLLYTFIIAIANPIGPLIFMTVSDRYERKAQIAIAALCIAVFGLAFSQQTGAVGILVFGILVTLSNNWMSFSFHAYQAELYPTQIRAQAVGFVYSWSRFSTIFTAFIIAFFLGRFGTTGVFVLIAACMVVVAVTIGGFGPRATRLRLEELNQ
jgi:MFS transporter, putative metabolite:H+ symporter